MVSEPTRVTIKPILFVTSSDHIVAPIRLRNYKSEDQQEEEEANEDGHAAEIEGQEGFLIPVGADEAGKGNKEDQKAEKDDRPPEEVDAAVVWLGSQPDSGCDDGDGAEEGYEVED